ncbi:hypothetical protein QJS04_geneDACA001440 [Acorus gramineus]|uniref:Uncharacterized protein n=1 Tax=Acorus gramineus TaxID=55184 RepID=A0AAV9A6G3_ACOGR|nr:hypothetical protein QJS04_geneDACA001440 [Acorus gramineus]
MVPLEEVANLKARKKKPSPQVASTLQINREIRKGQEQLPPTFKTHKSSKRGLKKEASPSFQQMDRSPSDFLPDSSMAQNEYRTLRRKYLLLEEKSALMMKELNEVEADVNTLEDEKFVLLDRLVVMEGLVDPSELEH